ncbi:type II toxin-antitoxin system HicA family toxin [Actinospica sp. MGRD01-02]|uniref:Type II toxin-antitoxin system HicA family toxin n=1 Tax=Actinospica acidithermotolerans TaxID=2828514 RepID=A0A941E4H2_9ACTN|nr:type II toxin-antitoxin system HicA family toxin [Actinospica acidithermotolerans]MBR7826070.1 type II toxin-antitoxin system HicA family toxin [Actinospica acidithermotolerans]
MKRRALLRELVKIAESKDLKLEFVRHGAGHDIYHLGHAVLIIGRHADIPEQTAKITLKTARNG